MSPHQLEHFFAGRIATFVNAPGVYLVSLARILAYAILDDPLLPLCIKHFATRSDRSSATPEYESFFGAGSLVKKSLLLLNVN